MAKSFAQRLKNLFKRSPGPSGHFPRSPAPVRRGAREITVAYRENAYFQSVLNLVADGVATPAWTGHKRIDEDGMIILDPALSGQPPAIRRKSVARAMEEAEAIECPGSPVLRLLAQPNPHMTGRAMLKLVSQWMDLHGECFLYLERGRSGQYLYPLPSHWVQLPTESAPQYRILPQAAAPCFPASVDARQMIHLRKPDPENPYGRGVGLGLGLADELDTSELVARTQKAIYSRGALPVTAIGIDAGPDADEDEVQKQIKALYESDHTGPSSQGKPWFIAGKLTATTINADLKSLQTQELQKSILDYIRMVFNVPPELVGDLTASNRATAESASYHLAEYAVAPRLEFLRTELQYRLVPLVDPGLILDYQDPRPQSYDRVSALMMNPSTAPVFTVAEVRDLAGVSSTPEQRKERLLPMPGQVLAAPAKPATEPDEEADSTPRLKLFQNV